MDGKAMILRALKPISANEEVFINYIDTTEPFINRQYELQLRYFFTCTCFLCSVGSATQLDAFCARFNESTSPAFQAAARAHLARRSDTLVYQNRYRAFDADTALLVAAESMVSEEYGRAQMSSTPEEELAAVKKVCRTCQDSGIWPVWRFPYAQARQNLAVLCLSQQRYLDALPHMAKLYLDIYPWLLPAAHHPLRVINAMSLLKLLIFVSGSREAPSLPLDIPASLFVIGTEVMANAVKSHGAEANFTKSCLEMIQQPLDEVRLKDKSAFSEARGVEAIRLLKAYADSAKF
jgi:hypothetical protein